MGLQVSISPRRIGGLKAKTAGLSGSPILGDRYQEAIPKNMRRKVHSELSPRNVDIPGLSVNLASQCPGVRAGTRMS
jgi:hypothetical protein